MLDIWLILLEIWLILPEIWLILHEIWLILPEIRLILPEIWLISPEIWLILPEILCEIRPILSQIGLIFIEIWNTEACTLIVKPPRVQRSAGNTTTCALRCCHAAYKVCPRSRADDEMPSLQARWSPLDTIPHDWKVAWFPLKYSDLRLRAQKYTIENTETTVVNKKDNISHILSMSHMVKDRDMLYIRSRLWSTYERKLDKDCLLVCTLMLFILVNWCTFGGSYCIVAIFVVHTVLFLCDTGLYCIVAFFVSHTVLFLMWYWFVAILVVHSALLQFEQFILKILMIFCVYNFPECNGQLWHPSAVATMNEWTSYFGQWG